MSAILRDARGGVSLLAAGSMVMLMAGSALAFDTGSLYLARRQLQGAADAAALAAAASSTDRTGAATRALAANGLSDARIDRLEAGGYTPDRTTPSGRRFAPNDAADDAARVTLSRDVPLLFGRIVTGRPTAAVGATATAARIDYAAFSIGSRLAREDGGLPGAILSALAGSSVTLSAGDYQALAAADIDLLAYADALRTRLGMTAASYDAVLATRTTLPIAVAALADATSPAAAAILRSIATTLSGQTITPADLVDPGVLGPRGGGGTLPKVAVDAYAMLRETLAVSNGSRQVAITPPAMAGIASLSVFLATGERAAHSPWIAIARDGSVTVRTAQSRLYIDAGLPGAATLGLVSLRVPIYVELAAAEARLAAIACHAGPASATVTLDVRPSVGAAAIADLDTSALASFGAAPTLRRATVAHALLADVTASSQVSFGGTRWQQAAFTRADIDARTIRTVTTDDIARGIASSLISKIDLRASAGGVTIPVSPLAATVGTAVGAAAPTIDALFNRMTALLGLGIGQADVRVDGVRCGKPTLVA